MKKNLLFLCSTLAVVGSGLFTSCSGTNEYGSHPHPGAKLFGNYSMNCTCDDIYTVPVESTPVSFNFQIAEIPGDTTSVEVLNLHNAGVVTTADILSPNSFNGSVYYIDGSLYQQTLTIWYHYANFNCQGSGLKQ